MEPFQDAIPGLLCHPSAELTNVPSPTNPPHFAELLSQLDIDRHPDPSQRAGPMSALVSHSLLSAFPSLQAIVPYIIELL
jgi:hypothetical protein